MKRPSTTSVIFLIGVLILFGGSVACSAQFNLTGPGEESGWPGGIMLAGLIFVALSFIVNYLKNSKTWNSKLKKTNPTSPLTIQDKGSYKASVQGEVVDDKK